MPKRIVDPGDRRRKSAKTLDKISRTPRTEYFDSTASQSSESIQTQGFALEAALEPNRYYFYVEATDNFKDWTVVAYSLDGSGTISYLDESAKNRPFRFYRIRGIR